MIRHWIKKIAVTAAAAGTLTAGLAAAPAQAAPAPAAQKAFAVSSGHGEIHPSGSLDLCVTANSADTGAVVHLDLCQAAASARQLWHIGFVRPTTASSKGVGLICLIGHPHLCLGHGKMNKDHYALVVLYHSQNPDGSPSKDVLNALTLYRNGSSDKPSGWKMGAAPYPGTRMIALGGIRFGHLLIWEVPKPSTPARYTLPRLHAVK